MKLLKAYPLVALIVVAACSRMGTPTTSAPTAAAPGDKPVATVNGIPISRDIYEYYVRNTAGKGVSDLTVDQRNQLLDNLVRGEIVAQEAEKQGLDKNGDTRSLLTLSRLQILEQ